MSHAHPRPSFRPPTLQPPDARVLVVVAHPAIHRSRVNKALAAAARAVSGVSVHDLYEAAPTGRIDVDAEQALLRAHDAIVLQHPLYWYSTPALLKEWLDQTLTFGWAYGPGGTALRGKTLLQVVSTGGPVAAYQPGAHNDATLPQLLLPMNRTARLCGMTSLPPLAVQGTHRLTDDQIRAAAAAYAAVLAALRDGALDATATTPEGCLDAARAVPEPA